MNLANIYYLHEIGGKKNQEDYIWPAAGTAVPEHKIFIVCDGVGGSENGEIASRMIAEYTGNILVQAPPENISTAYINELLAAAKQNMVTHARTAGLNKDMATTFSLLVLLSDKAFIAWCGDSRVYHIRNGEILYKTADHSLVNTLVKNGEITEPEARLHPQKHIILKAITGDDTTAEAEGQWIMDLADGDYFMLCTDGLLENITDSYLSELLSSGNPAQKDLIQAIQEKCFGKTRDNYSMYLLQTGFSKKTVLQKKKTGYGAVWLILLALVMVAGGLFFFNKKNAAATVMPVPNAGNADSAVVAPSNTNIIKKDTILQPGKNLSPDSELINKEEAEERKIAPAPLPETKPVVDSALQKKILQKETDPVNAHPQPRTKNGPVAQKKDSLNRSSH